MGLGHSECTRSKDLELHGSKSQLHLHHSLGPRVSAMNAYEHVEMGNILNPIQFWMFTENIAKEGVLVCLGYNNIIP